MEFYRRIGQFFFFLGVILLFLFWAALESSDEQVLPLMFCGGLSFVAGVLLYWRNRQPPGESERFRTIRKLLNRDKDKRRRLKQRE